MKECKLNSFALHPQIKVKHANKESAKLTNHDTTPSPASVNTSSSSSGDFTTAQPSAQIVGTN